MRHIARALAGCGLLLWLAMLTGCVTHPEIIKGAASRDAAQLTQWRAVGRLGVSSPAQSGSGAFIWQQTQVRSEINLRGPVGVGALQVTVQGEQVSLQAGNGETYDAAAAMSELERRLGSTLPLQELPYWLRGIAAPGAAEWEQAHTVLKQAGWQITYSEWSERDALRLPVRLVIQHDAVRIVAKIQQWQLDAP